MFYLAIVVLPESLQFFNTGWWILHIVAISTVGLIGFFIGVKRRIPRDAAGGPYLPEQYRFFRVGWWLTHAVAITLVFIIGYLVGFNQY